ncbi:DUF2953 domain-containing protein [Pontibacillus salicampi]|uniref:DUF2953 domain-containing protein n=1 Tax=Pontibacillus salicampi TaxID=1449801 RepID=A0ABV6LIZ3_9BACI
MWMIGIILFLILNLCIIILSKLRLSLLYLHKDDKDFVRLELRFLHFVKIKKEIPLVAFDKEDMSIKTEEKTEVGNQNKGEESKNYTPKEILHRIKEFQSALQRVVGMHRIIRRFLRKVSIHSFQWETQVGLPSASTTGMVCGAIWAAKGSVVGVLSHFMQLKTRPDMKVTPFFQQTHSYTRLECMISFRFGQAIFAVFQIVRYTRGKVPKWRRKTA